MIDVAVNSLAPAAISPSRVACSASTSSTALEKPSAVSSSRCIHVFLRSDRPLHLTSYSNDVLCLRRPTRPSTSRPSPATTMGSAMRAASSADTWRVALAAASLWRS